MWNFWLSLFRYRYDFDGDDLIQPEDVRILLSYVPFKTEEDLGGT